MPAMSVMSLSDGQGTWNLGGQLTLFQQGGQIYAHHITACPPGFENLTASLHIITK